MDLRRRRAIILAVVLLALAALVAIIVVSATPPQNANSRTPAANKVGMVLNGSADDGGFTQALHEAAQAVCAEMGMQFISRDGISADDFPATAQQLIDIGCGMILCDSEAFDDDLVELAAKNPRVRFINAMGTVKGHNLASCMRRTYQARYLTGIVAGLQTQTNEIGYVVSSLTLETIRQLNAFTLGARKANPKATVFVRCTNDRYDEDAAAQTMDALLDAHDIDVVSSHAVPTSALAAADKRNTWTIGYCSNSETPFPRTWLTGYTFDWKPFYTLRFEEWQDNRFVGKQYRGGIRNGLVSLAPLSDLVRPGTQAVVDAELDRLMNGTFDVFFGPIVDNSKTMRVRDGEALSDEQILHGMDWFVEGVVTE